MKQLLLILFIFPVCVFVYSEDLDEFCFSPCDTYEKRKIDFLEYHAVYGAEEGLTGIFRQVSRAGLGLDMEEDNIRKCIDVIRSNRDCNDFTLNGLIRLVYMNQAKDFISESLMEEIRACILDFKYWWDDGRRDTTYRCYHTENHQALYHTAELLAGQIYKNSLFTNGMTGNEHLIHAYERLHTWLDFRLRFGFSEWLSTYYEVEVMLLANLYDYAEDINIRRKAGQLLDRLMLDMALYNYKGVLASTSGRIYANSLITGTHGMSPLMKLIFGVGVYQADGCMAPAAICTGTYHCPESISKLAVDYSSSYYLTQRVSLNVEDAPLYHISYQKEPECHLFWGMQEFIHPLVIETSKRISEQYDTWPYRNYDEYMEKYSQQRERYGEILDSHLDRFALSEANIAVCRTGNYMLSSVQDYRKGALGYQQHIWQATLGNKAVVFTNHPGSKNMRSSPNYWAGSQRLPRAAQYQNVVICIYDIPEEETNLYTHAYFPYDAFDEVIYQGNWIFGRKDEGYVGLYSSGKTEYKEDESGVKNDLIAIGRQNIWICETGSQEEWGDFSSFINALMKSEIQIAFPHIAYNSPSQGKVSFGWNTPLSVAGTEHLLRFPYYTTNELLDQVQ